MSDLRGYALGAAAIEDSGLPAARLTNVTAPGLAGRLSREPPGGQGLFVPDVREPVEWDEGHVTGAHHIPSVLLAQGFTDLPNSWGGMSAWIEAGRPLARN